MRLATDPRVAPANRLTVTWALFYSAPGKADGPRRAAQATPPLAVSVGAAG